MTYKEQINNPKWQKKRLEILERDGFTCVLCNGKTKTLHVHHKWYNNKLKYWEYPDECYITLCKDCHKIVHKYIFNKSISEYDIILSKLNEILNNLHFSDNSIKKEINELDKDISNNKNISVKEAFRIMNEGEKDG